MELSSVNEAKNFRWRNFKEKKRLDKKQQENQGSLNYHKLTCFFFLGGGFCVEQTNANVCYVILREFPFFESKLFWVGNIMTFEEGGKVFVLFFHQHWG